MKTRRLSRRDALAIKKKLETQKDMENCFGFDVSITDSIFSFIQFLRNVKKKNNNVLANKCLKFGQLLAYYNLYVGKFCKMYFFKWTLVETMRIYSKCSSFCKLRIFLFLC
jgi:hypothetical protein